MGTWITQAQVAGLPDDVLDLLTDPEAIARWSPIGFEVLEFDGERLQAGDRVRVRGGLAGRTLDFAVEVADAEDGRLALTAIGPIRLDVEYVALVAGDGTEVQATVAVSGHGLMGRLIAQATDALLAAGALSAAVGRIARELELEPALAA